MEKLFEKVSIKERDIEVDIKETDVKIEDISSGELVCFNIIYLQFLLP